MNFQSPLKRETEPELMQSLDQVLAYSNADFSFSDNLLIFRLEECLLKAGKCIGPDSVIVDIGCGPGNIAERIAAKWPTATVVGIDGSQSMLALARERRKQKRVDGELLKLNYSCLDIASIVQGNQILNRPADVIVSNSLMHHLHDLDKFFLAIRSLSKDGTLHLHRDLRRPLSYDIAKDLQKNYLPRAPKILIHDYLASLHAAFSVQEIKTHLENEGLDYFKVLELEDRYLEVVGIFGKPHCESW